ncbi:MAG TPA: metalloregulator ArsR/SmtB family transcription factor [Terriglobales bacterium]|nr:metalloregulator ArsR/SmtB family transcription factor [Terriglobales bacterium]
MSRKTPRAAAQVFAALGDATRLALVMRLSQGPARSIAELSAESRLTRQAMTKHLRVLERARLVRSRRTGREKRFAFRPDSIMELQEYLAAVSAQWDGALERLRTLVEEGS